jgi:uncharacterized protein (TIGR03437 family)
LHFSVGVRVFPPRPTYRFVMFRFTRIEKPGAALLAALFLFGPPLPGQTRPQPAAPFDISPEPNVTAIANAASDVVGPIAPGEIVTVYGSGLGPAQVVSLSSLTGGIAATQLADTQVLFNGIPAPILSTWNSAVSAIVPYGTVGTAAQVTVAYLGQVSAPITVALAPAAPGVFVWGLLATGQGQALVINQGGSINSAGSPAPIGSIVTLYATGEGQTSPAGVDGKVAGSPTPQPVLPVAVTVGGQTVTPLYAGGAPGELAGVMQINVRIPTGVQKGTLPISIQVGGASSQAGVTIAVTSNPLIFGDIATSP